MNETASLGVTWDSVHYAKGNDEYDIWTKGLPSDYLHKLELFVATCIPNRGPAKAILDTENEGSYNKVIRFTFPTVTAGTDVALKFPKPGHTVAALVAEKVANEAAWMQFLKENTSIPVPHIYSSGTESGNLLPALNIPYILMDWVPGVNLRDFLKTESGVTQRQGILEQIASFYLEFYRLPMDGIGSMFKDKTTGKWSLRRPLTIDMHQLALGVPDYPIHDWPGTKFEDVSSYFEFVAKQQRHHQLWIHRNLNEPQKVKDYTKDDKPEDNARLRYEARYRITQLFKVDTFCPAGEQLGPFRTFIPDFDLRNMNFDPETGLVGVFDFEFTNAMPISFACDPPLSLYSSLPAATLDHGFFPWFLHVYEPVLDEFLEVMKKEEAKLREAKPDQIPLSTLMRNSWTSDRVWFNYALTNSDHIDAVYWAVLHKQNPEGDKDLPDNLKADMERYVAHTKEQLVLYKNAVDKYRTESK